MASKRGRRPRGGKKTVTASKPAHGAKATPSKAKGIALQSLRPHQVESVRRATNLIESLSGALSGRFRMLGRAGIQYGGKRDIYAVAGYPPEETVRFEDYWGFYVRNEIGGRIVDMPAKTTWRKPPDIYEEDSPDGTSEFTSKFEDLAKRMHLWRYFERVDRLAGIGQYAVLLLGVKGVDDSTLRQPLARLPNADALIYLGVYHEANASIAKWVTDAGDPRYGQPELYKINLSSGVAGFPKSQVLVHWSRVIHVAEDALEDDVFGRPRMQRALNRLYDLDKITASVGESFWQSATRILRAQIDPEAEMDEPGLQDLEDKMAEMVHDLRRQFIGQGTELSWLPTEASEPKSIADLYFELISAACGIPRRILFGNEAGELASTTDQATYFGMIDERQEHYAEPIILRAFIDRLLKLGALPQPMSGEYDVDWPSLFQLTELEQADANLKRAQAVAALTPQGGDPMALAEIDEDRNIWPIPHEPNPEVPPMEVLPTIGPDGQEVPGTGTALPVGGAPGATSPATPPAPTPGGPDPQEAHNYLEQIGLIGTQVQTLIFPKRHWTSAAAAKAWARQHSFRVDKVDETSNSFRLRQGDPGDFSSFRTICLMPHTANPGASACRVKAVVGRPRG